MTPQYTRPKVPNQLVKHFLALMIAPSKLATVVVRAKVHIDEWIVVSHNEPDIKYDA
jgi:hypothetical protein